MPASTLRGRFECSNRIGLFLAAFALLAVAGCKKNEAAAPPAPPDVEVASVVERDVPIYAEWVATLDGFINAQVPLPTEGD